MKRAWMIGLLVGALALTSCGREVGDDGGDDAATDDTASDAGDGETDDSGDDAGDAGDGAAAAAECEADEVDGDLRLFNWAEYMDPELLEAFAEEYGVTATEDTYTSNEALIAQIRAGGADYDVIIPSDYMVEIMIEEGMILELDHDAIPNMDNVDEDFADPPYDPGLRYSMPFQWGTTGLAVNLDDTGPDPEPTWGWLLDPEMAGQLSGQISLLDDPREGMAAALYYLGYDPNTQDEAELEEAAGLIEQAGEWTATYESDQPSELLVTGEVAAAQGYSGGFLDTFFEVDEDGEQYAYLIPEEGATIWTDNMAILADSAAPCTAHTFVNYILDAENGAQLSNWTWYASPNAAAMEHLDEELAEDPVVFPDEDVRENLHFLENTGEAEILYTDLFTRAQG